MVVGVVYWGTGAVYRWNEIARELAARYNLAPPSNAEGKYPVPDAANPLAEPKFPFANPPYTARALAYLSVAQYDALVTAWNFKYKYKRTAPSKTDTTIPAPQSSQAKSPLPSLPFSPALPSTILHNSPIHRVPSFIPHIVFPPLTPIQHN